MQPVVAQVQDLQAGPMGQDGGVGDLRQALVGEGEPPGGGGLPVHAGQPRHSPDTTTLGYMHWGGHQN